MTAEHRTDICIIGAGPVGLFAIFECGMLKMHCHVVDALDMTGGQCAALYPEKPIYDIPGYPAIDAVELIAKLEQQVAPFHPVYHLGRRVEQLSPQGDGDGAGDGWLVRLDDGSTIAARAVIIAAGVGAFGPNKPPLEGIEQYEGKGVHYLVTRREEFRGRRIVIAGGGDSAVDWAISLAEVAEAVYMVHRRPKFRAAPESVSRMEALAKAGKIEMVVPYQLAAIEGHDKGITAVIVATLESAKRRLEADALLPFFGLAMNLGPIAEWGLELERNNIKIDPATCATSRPGIFAIGDVATYPGKLKLILCGFSEAAMAAHAIYPLVHPGEALHFEYSTTKGVPKE